MHLYPHGSSQGQISRSQLSTMLFFTLFFSCVGVALGAANPPKSFSCTKKFWPNFEPGQGFTVATQCQWFPGYPQTIQGVDVSVVHTLKWGKYATNNNLFDQVSDILDDALTSSLTTYGDLDDLPPKIVIILSRRELGETFADTIYPDGDPPCQIRVFETWNTYITSNDEWTKQALAHELYHCVEEEMMYMGPSAYPDTLWVTEGGANYFSNVVFPDANIEQRPKYVYDPTKQIYAQVGPGLYATSLYFQSLEQPRGVEYLNSWIMDTPEDPDLDERTRLSTLDGFTDDFYEFAQQFSLGSIIDTDGSPVSGLSELAPDAKVVQIALSQGSGSATVETNPDTIHVFQLSLPAGHTYSLSAGADDHQHVAYRLNGDLSGWTDLDSDGVDVDLACGDDAAILILFISTKDADTDDVAISAVQQDNNPDCDCQSSSGTRRRRQASQCSQPPSTSTGTCGPNNIVVDPCLTANTWNLDLDLLKQRIEQEVSDVSQVEVSGSGTLKFTSTTAEFAYDNLDISFHVEIDDTDTPITEIINGKFDANVFTTKKNSDICLIMTSGEGTVDETDPLTGGFEIDLTPTDGWVSSEYDIQYTCDASTLYMAGFYKGSVAWGPWVYMSG
jgi:hypothetical protein